MAKYKEKNAWTYSTHGQVFTAKVLTSTGRILAEVEVEVPLLPGYSVDERLKDEGGKEKLEVDARDLAMRIARAMLNPPQRS